MRKLKYKKHLPLFILLILVAFISISQIKMVNAEDMDVNIILSEDNQSSSPIFNDSDPPLAPGLSINKKFNIQNKTIRSYYINAIKITNFSLKDINNNLITDRSMIDYFCDKVKCKIEKVGRIDIQLFNGTIYDGSLSKLVEQDGLVIDNESLSIASSSSKKFAIQLGMETSANNTLQGLSANMDIQMVAISKDNSNSNPASSGNPSTNKPGNPASSDDPGTNKPDNPSSSDNISTLKPGKPASSINTSTVKSCNAVSKGNPSIIKLGNSVSTDNQITNKPDNPSSSDNPSTVKSSNSASSGNASLMKSGNSVSSTFTNFVKTCSSFHSLLLVVIGSLFIFIVIVISRKKLRINKFFYKYRGGSYT